MVFRGLCYCGFSVCVRLLRFGLGCLVVTWVVVGCVGTCCEVCCWIVVGCGSLLYCCGSCLWFGVCVFAVRVLLFVALF